jgi:ligand-binding sensor domain-containing protein
MGLNAKIIYWTFCLSVVVHIFISKAIAQPECYFEHFGVEDGLPQHTVMDILQDKKGFMWFATWNGLC